MYDLIFESLRKSTESAIQVQQEMFRTWANFWSGRPAQFPSFAKRWADTFGDLIKKQEETLEAQYNAGLKIIEDGFATTKGLEELRAKLINDWKKNLESQRQVAEAQMQTFQAALVRWTEEAGKGITWLTGASDHWTGG